MAFMGILIINIILTALLGILLFYAGTLVAFLVFLILSFIHKDKKWIKITRNIIGIVFAIFTVILLAVFCFVKFGI